MTNQKTTKIKQKSLSYLLTLVYLKFSVLPSKHQYELPRLPVYWRKDHPGYQARYYWLHRFHAPKAGWMAKHGTLYVGTIQSRCFKVSFCVCCMIFLNVSNKSRNMKTLVVLSHPWSQFLTLTFWYEENKLLWGPMSRSGIFFEKELPPPQITISTLGFI